MPYTREILKMAKVMIEVDTEEGTVSATVNGKAVDDVTSISVYKMIDPYSKKQEPEIEVYINSATKDEAGVKTYKSICAEKSVGGRTAITIGTIKSNFDDFVVNPVVREPQDGEYVEAKESVKKAFSGIFGSRRVRE